MSLLKNINLNGTLLEIADTTARENADNAITLANSAQGTADTAKSTADTALSKAKTAQGTADTAKSTADTALSKANAAQKTADSKALITYTESEMTMYIK
jgi:F0F1-type ATP synthase epsilon subunit